MTNEKQEMILCIVNSGFSDTVMNAARGEGAKGGTVFSGRGTANKEAEQFFGITVQPEKDIVLLLVPAKIKDKVLHAIYKNAGQQTEAQGIAFSVPVNAVVGIAPKTEEPSQE